MSIKSIFKILIGTMVILVMSSLVVELFNINTTSLQLNSITKMSVRQGCVFFGQETYKRDDAQNINMGDLYNNTGGIGVTGNFYGPSSDPKQIYDKLYGASSDFLSSTGDMVRLKDNWENLKLIVDNNDAWQIGEMYRENLITPLNMGIPYMDKNVLEHIARWNLASILNNGARNGVNNVGLYGSNTNAYVAYKGYNVYVNQLEITDIEYRVFDLNTPDGESNFNRYTHMDPDVIKGQTMGIGDERNKVCIAGISYKVPMSYVGVTPIKSIMKYMWDTRVEGMKGRVDASDPSRTPWDLGGTAELSQGGFGESTARGMLPVPGELVYYIIR